MIITAGLSTTESVLKLIGLLFLFVLIIIACYFTTRFVAGRQLGQRAKISNFKAMDVFRISQNKYLQLMKIGRKYIVLAVCKDTITVIAELDEEDIVSSESATGTSFKDILHKMSKNKEDSAPSKFPDFKNTDDRQD